MVQGCPFVPVCMGVGWGGGGKRVAISQWHLWPFYENTNEISGCKIMASLHLSFTNLFSTHGESRWTLGRKGRAADGLLSAGPGPAPGNSSRKKRVSLIPNKPHPSGGSRGRKSPPLRLESTIFEKENLSHWTFNAWVFNRYPVFIKE